MSAAEPEPKKQDETPRPEEALGEDPSPFLGRWRNVYWVVVVELAATVVLLFALTRWAS